MQGLLSKNILYSFLLIFLPVLATISWVNVIFNNFNTTDLSLVIYIFTYVVPTIVVAYVVAILAAENLNNSYNFTLPKIVFSLFFFLVTLFFFSYGFSFMGFESKYVMLNISGSANPEEHAAKFYSIQMIVEMIVLVIFYSIANFVFGDKSFHQLVPIKKIKFRKFRMLRIQRKMRVTIRKAFRLSF